MTMPERWRRIREIFNEAAELPSADERHACLERACEGDAALREEVEALLAADAANSSVLDGTPTGLARNLAPAEEAEEVPSYAGRTVGPYRLLEEIGRGGMGAVYLAEREDLDKRVALKVVRGGLASPEHVQRFLLERRLLARLEHPNIARLLDAGLMEDGTPWFAMEYVEGRPIDRYADEHSLTVRQRLELFAQVCAAVQYAHRNLIVHRDLKPGNILVAEPNEGAAGEVRLLDFGIAKLLGDERQDELTGTGLRLLTPEFAAPEQVIGEPVTTATDVYALGVVLYQLLSGHRPYRVAGRSLRELERVVLIDEAPRPSTMVGKPIEDAPEGDRRARVTPEATALARRVRPEQLRRQLAGDLDTIILKALAKEPERRYPSAQQLLDDLERHLQGLPVSARPDTWNYRTRKFVRRHRVGVAFAATLALLLAGFAGAMGVQAERIARARDLAAARQGQAEELIGFMVGDLRGKLTPIGRLDVLDDVGTRALGYFAAVPESELSDEELFRRTEALRQLGEVRLEQGKLAEALEIFQQSLALSRGLAARDTERGGWQVGLGASYFWIGFIHWRQGDAARALEYMRPYLNITEALVAREPDNHEYQLELGYATSNIGSILEAQGDFRGALDAFRSALEVTRQLATHDPADRQLQLDVAESYGTIGTTQYKLGLLDEALASHRSELAIKQALVDQDRGNATWRMRLAVARQYLGKTLQAKGLNAEALEHLLAARDIYVALVAHDSTNTAWRAGLASAERGVGEGLLAVGRAREALPHFQKSRGLVDVLVARDPNNAVWTQQLTSALVAESRGLVATRRTEPARRSADRAIGLIDALVTTQPRDQLTLEIAARAHLQQGNLLAHLDSQDAARAHWSRAVELTESVADQARSPDVRALWSASLMRLGRSAEAQTTRDELDRIGYRHPDYPELAKEVDGLN